MDRKPQKQTHRGLDVRIRSVVSEREFVAVWRVKFPVYECILSTMDYDNIPYCLVHLQ